MNISLEVNNVTKKYLLKDTRPATLKEYFVRRLTGRLDRRREFWALRGVSFSLENEKVLGIIGHNGSGKSTLLRLMAGLGVPTSGTIRCSGKVGCLLELGTGFNPEFTGRQNLITGGIMAGLRRHQVLERQDDIIAFAELEDFIDQPVKTYSSGMFLRLAFATAVLFDPDILLIDEVLSVGDYRFQQKCMDKLQHFRRSGKSIILVSHDLDQIRNLCNEVVVLEEGKVIIHADPDTAISCYYDLMRQRTEKRKQMLGGAIISPPGDNNKRHGTFEATIEAVNIKKSDGYSLNVVRGDEDFIIEIVYCNQSFLPDVAINLGIFTSNNFKCFEVSIPSLLSRLGPLGKQGFLRCHIRGLPLLPGRYYINLGLYPTSWEYIYDYHWQMHSLEVQTGKTNNLGVSGVVSLDYSFSLETDSHPD